MTWVKGQSGNPHGGRPSNARRVVSDAFVRSMARAWKEHGDKVIKDVVRDHPEVFLRVMASLVPKDMFLGSDDEGGLVINIVKHVDYDTTVEKPPLKKNAYLPPSIEGEADADD